MKYTDESGKDAETMAVLMDKAYAQGFLLTDDIIEAFPKAEEANEQLEELFAFLHGASIEVYEDKAQVPVRPSTGRKPRRPEEEEFDLSTISTDDTVGLYLKEMARVPLLTTEQEVDLAKRLERGLLAQKKLDKLNGSTGYKKRAELLGHVEDGRGAREHLIKANTRLVVSIAKKVHWPRRALPRPDPGRQPGPDEGCGKVRLPPRLPLLHLCHLVDPPDHHPRHRRPGPHHPRAGAHE